MVCNVRVRDMCHSENPVKLLWGGSGREFTVERCYQPTHVAVFMEGNPEPVVSNVVVIGKAHQCRKMLDQLAQPEGALVPFASLIIRRFVQRRPSAFKV